MSTELTRRALVVGALAATAGGGAWWFREQRRERRRAALLGLAADFGLAGAGDLGSAYLALHPGEADAARLESLLLAGDWGDEHAALRSRLAERIGRDWIELETVQLDGWILARSEGRLLALVTLLSTEVPPERG